MASQQRSNITAHYLESFMKKQGILQGGVLSAEQYKTYTNPLLDQRPPPGLPHIGDITIATSYCVDDGTVISSSRHNLQVMNKVCQANAHRERYIFSEPKTKMSLKSRYSTLKFPQPYGMTAVYGI